MNLKGDKMIENNQLYYTNKFGVRVLLSHTNSYSTFIRECNTFEYLRIFLLSARHDINAIKANILRDFKFEDSNNLNEEFEMYFRSKESDQIFNAYAYQDYLGQIVFCRLVDNALCYFKDILTEVVLKEPRILISSKEHMNLSFILSHENMEDLIVAISDKKIRELFYGNIEDIKKFFKDRIGIELFDNNDEENSFSLIIKKRNIIVHNRGIISKEFAREISIDKSQIGSILKFTYDQLSVINGTIADLIVDIDIKLRQKFDLDVLTNSKI